MDNKIRKYCESCKFYSVLGCQSTLICRDGNRFLAADVQTVDRWISVDEALPNSGETVLIYYNNQLYTAKYNGDFAETIPWSGSGHWWGKELISFWQPLPKPPEPIKG